MSILKILNELAATTSTNEKVAIIEREKDNELLKRVFQAAYNPMITYGIKQIPEYKYSEGMPYSLSSALDFLKFLSSREYTGNLAINALSTQLGYLGKDDAVVLERIIQRDLRCGTSDSLASRVWVGFVPTFDVMLAHKDISGIKYPAYAQIKSDGARAHVYFDGTRAIAVSRNGKPIELHGVLDEDMLRVCDAGDTLDGELVCFKDGKPLDRKTSNGIVNKAVKGTISKEEATLIHLMCWDKVDFTSTITYDHRIHELGARCSRLPADSKIKLLATHVVNNEDEVHTFFEECIAAGEEGCMVKNMKSRWVPKRSKEIGKVKAEEVADLKVVAIEQGTNKYAGKMGALVCETSDGLLRVNVGTGFSDDDREVYYDNSILDKIIEVKYNQLITSKSKDKASLFLPRFVSVRVDKDVANSLGELK